MPAPRISRKKQPKKARGADFHNLTRSRWHELAVRAVLYVERINAGKLRYSDVTKFLMGCDVRDAWGREISRGTLKRTLKRTKLRNMLRDFRIIYRDATDAELLQFDPAAPTTLRQPATPTFEDVQLFAKQEALKHDIQ